MTNVHASDIKLLYGCMYMHKEWGAGGRGREVAAVHVFNVYTGTAQAYTMYENS